MRATKEANFSTVAAVVAPLLAVGLLLSCQSPAPPTGPSIRDQAGRQVRLPEKVESVVCLWPETTRIIYALGAKDLLVGVDDRARDDPVLKRVWPGIEQVPVVGMMQSVNMEELVSLRPDLVIVSARSKRLAEQIASRGLAVVCFHPRGKWENYLEEITLVGRCIGRSREAGQLRTFLEEKMGEVTSVVASVPKSSRPRVYVTFAYDPLRTTPLDSVERAGGINLASGNRDIWYTVDMEWLLERDPDAIVQHALGKFDLAKMGGGWSSLRAVKQGNIYRVFLGYCGVDPAGYIFQVRQMAALFHQPDTPWAKDLMADGRAIFERVYGQPGVFEQLVEEMKITLAKPRRVATER